jgi:hypothetical protein
LGNASNDRIHVIVTIVKIAFFTELEVLRQRNAEPEVKIAGLEEVWKRRVTLQKEKIIELKNKNARLRQKLESRIEDHESRLAEVEQGSPLKDEQADDTKRVSLEGDSTLNNASSTAPSERPIGTEDEEKHQREHSTQVKKSQSHKKKEAENIVKDVFDFTATSTEISVTARHEKSDAPPNILQNPACLIQEAWMRKMKQFKLIKKNYCVGVPTLLNSIKKP